MTSIVAAPKFAPSTLKVGASINTALRVFAQGWWKLILVTLLPMAPYYAYIFLVGASTLRDAQTGTISTGGYFAAAAVRYGILIVLSVFSSTTCIAGAHLILRGEDFSLAAALRQALQRLPSALGASFLMLLAMAVGFALLVVPGFVALAMFFVASPVVVIERAGPLAALARSRQLTKGARWKCLGAIGLTYLTLFVSAAVLGGTGAALGGLIGYQLGSIPPSIVFSAFIAVLTTVVYRDLRRAKEGVGADVLAGVFE